MEETTKKIVRGTLSLSMVEMSSILTGLVSSAIILRYFGPANIGLLAIATSAFSLLTTIDLLLPQALNTFIPRHLALNDQRGVLHLLWASYLVDSVITLLTSVLGLAIAGIVSLIFHNQLVGVLLSIAALVNLLSILNGPVTGAALRSFQEYRWNLVLEIVLQFVSLAVAGGTVWFRLSLIDYQWAQAVVIFPTAIWSWGYFFFLHRRTKASATISISEALKKIINFSWPNLVNNLIYKIYLNVGNLIAGYFISPVAAGYHSVVLSIVEKLVLFLTILPQALHPALAEVTAVSQERFRQLFQVSYRLVLAVSVTTTLLVISASREIMLVLGGARFAGAYPLLSLMALQVIFRVPTHPLANIYYLKEKTKALIGVNLIKATTELLSYLILLPIFGLPGLIVSHVLSYIFSGMRMLPEGLRLADSPKLWPLSGKVIGLTAVSGVLLGWLPYSGDFSGVLIRFCLGVGLTMLVTIEMKLVSLREVKAILLLGKLWKRI